MVLLIDLTTSASVFLIRDLYAMLFQLPEDQSGNDPQAPQYQIERHYGRIRVWTSANAGLHYDVAKCETAEYQ